MIQYELRDGEIMGFKGIVRYRQTCVTIAANYFQNFIGFG
jgi:hypothetical protein